MTDGPSPSDPFPTRAERDRADRLAREARALRDNLHRRKQQSRARSKVGTDADPGSPDASPGASPRPGDPTRG